MHERYDSHPFVWIVLQRPVIRRNSLQKRYEKLFHEKKKPKEFDVGRLMLGWPHKNPSQMSWLISLLNRKRRYQNLIVKEEIIRLQTTVEKEPIEPLKGGTVPYKWTSVVMYYINEPYPPIAFCFFRFSWQGSRSGSGSRSALTTGLDTDDGQNKGLHLHP